KRLFEGVFGNAGGGDQHRRVLNLAEKRCQCRLLRFEKLSSAKGRRRYDCCSRIADAEILHVVMHVKTLSNFLRQRLHSIWKRKDAALRPRRQRRCRWLAPVRESSNECFAQA